MYKSSNINAEDPEKLAAHTPVEIGTRGTVGSLIKKEIEYFSRLEVSSQMKPHSHVEDIASSSSHPQPAIVSALTTQKKKKKRANSLPSICSMVEVSDNSRPRLISSLSYRSLKSDVKNLQA